MSRVSTYLHTLVLLSLSLAACGPKEVDDIDLHKVTLPDNSVIRAVMVYNSIDMARGMMFRQSLPEDQGMLFVHQTPGTYGYWMYQVLIPLDILWLDANKRVVETSLRTPPCKEQSARKCPTYGGNKQAQYVLELAAGVAERHNIKLGDSIRF